MDLGLLEEFRFDWELAGKAARTVDDYIAVLRLLFAGNPEPDHTVREQKSEGDSYPSSLQTIRIGPVPNFSNA